MEEKLKSISRQIPWSLVLKAGLFAAAWYFLPHWIFLFVALYLCFVPIGGAAKVAAPFFVLMVVAFVEPPSLIFALIFGIIFYYLLLIRDLLIIDRRSAYEILVFALTFLFLRIFFLKEGGNFGGASLFYGLFIAFGLSWMISNYLNVFFGVEKANIRSLRAAQWFSFIVIWQLLIVGLFLPLDFIYQTVAVFLIAMVFIDLVPPYLSSGTFPRVKALMTSTVAFALLAIVLSSARWGL